MIGRDDVRQDMRRHHVERAGAAGARREDVVALLHRERRGAHEARDRGPVDDRDDEDDAPEAGRARMRELAREAELGQIERGEARSASGRSGSAITPSVTRIRKESSRPPK